MALELVALRGPDHPELGRVASTEVTGVGLALSAGARPDHGAHVDPNEDALLAAVGPTATLVAALDGNGGFAAAGAALAALEAAAPTRLRAAASDRTVAALVRDAELAAGAARNGGRGPTHASGVAISVALVAADGTVWAATRGDTAVVRLGATVRAVSGVAPHLDHTASPAPVQLARLAPGERLLVASDGFFDAVGRAWSRLAADVTSRSPGQAARMLVQRACEAGADDNVGVAVFEHRAGRRRDDQRRDGT